MGNDTIKYAKSGSELVQFYSTSPKKLEDLIVARDTLKLQNAIIGGMGPGVNYVLRTEYTGKVIQGYQTLLSLTAPSDDEILDLKIDASIASYAQGTLKAQVDAISNRINRVFGDTTRSQKEAEIITALNECEKIYGELNDQKHVFQRNALRFAINVLAFVVSYTQLLDLAQNIVGDYNQAQTYKNLRNLLERYLKLTLVQRLQHFVLEYARNNESIDSLIKDTHLNIHFQSKYLPRIVPVKLKTLDGEVPLSFDANEKINAVKVFEQIRIEIMDLYTNKFNEVVTAFSKDKLLIPDIPREQQSSWYTSIFKHRDTIRGSQL